jgi:hypothetical protein
MQFTVLASIRIAKLWHAGFLSTLLVIVVFSDVSDVLDHGMIAQVVELPLAQRAKKASPGIVPSQPVGETADPPSSVEIDFASHVPVAHPSRGNPSHDVVVIHPTVVTNFQKLHHFSIPYSRRAEREDGARFRGNL